MGGAWSFRGIDPHAEKGRTLKHRLTVISDTHAGSTVGLAPPRIRHPEGATIQATPPSEYLWRIYGAQLEQEARWAQGHDLHTLVFLGDIMDGGMHHGTVQLYHPNPAVERWIAGEVVMEAVRILNPTHVMVVLGTVSHVGPNGSREESVGAQLAHDLGEHIGDGGRGLIRPNADRYGWQELRAVMGGVPVDLKHHGKMGQLPHTRESYAKRYAFDIWSSQAMYLDGLSWDRWLAFRAHRHKFGDTGPVAPHKRGVRLVSCPCFQISTDWALGRAFEERPCIGMVGATLEDGMEHLFPQVVYPEPPTPMWTP